MSNCWNSYLEKILYRLPVLPWVTQNVTKFKQVLIILSHTFCNYFIYILRCKISLSGLKWNELYFRCSVNSILFLYIIIYLLLSLTYITSWPWIWAFSSVSNWQRKKYLQMIFYFENQIKNCIYIMIFLLKAVSTSDNFIGISSLVQYSLDNLVFRKSQQK